MNVIPKPTAGEQATLDLHIGSWGERTPIQQGLCLGVLRGHNSWSKLEQYVGVPESVLYAEARPLWGCLLWDQDGVYMQ